jgi:sterol desaturase/sphingolipid hydroxylase (fatty acid hydroxylase superfamily)
MTDALKHARPETTRMFESDLIERFSRIHPATPFVFWVPVIGVCLYRTWQRQLPLGLTAELFVAGILLWTLTEYVLHKYVFHWVNDTAWGKRIHFVLHGVHHDFPNDKDRLVMPLGASIPLGVVIYAIFYAVFGQLHGEAIYAGMALGYLAYDGTHYAVHHFKQTTRVGKYLRRHHMLHHHADHDGGFGVSSPLWDLVFQTMPRAKKRASAEATA